MALVGYTQHWREEDVPSLSDYFETGMVFLAAGMRTGFAIFVGYITLNFFPDKFRKFVLRDDWRTSTTDHAFRLFIIGALVLTVFYTVVGPYFPAGSDDYYDPDY